MMDYYYSLDSLAQVMSLHVSAAVQPDGQGPPPPPAYSRGLRIGERKLAGESGRKVPRYAKTCLYSVHSFWC